MTDNTEHCERLLKLPEVERITSLKRSTIYNKIKLGQFPAPLKLTERSSAWRESQIQEWINSRPVALQEGAR